MQENVKVFTPEVLVEVFGNVRVKGDFTYKLQVDHINSRELSQLAKINEDYGMNFHVRRSGKGLIVFSPAIKNDKSEVTQQFPRVTVRDYFELDLNQDARIAAFENTAKIKLDNPTKNLGDAILQSFYISETPQGACYWQDIICDSI